MATSIDGEALAKALGPLVAGAFGDFVFASDRTPLDALGEEVASALLRARAIQDPIRRGIKEAQLMDQLEAMAEAKRLGTTHWGLKEALRQARPAIEGAMAAVATMGLQVAWGAAEGWIAPD